MPELNPPAPDRWRVENHTFIGYVLVNREDTEAKGAMKRRVLDWILYAMDLRPINSIRVSDHLNIGHTDLSHNGTCVATVNAPFDELLPHFLAARSVFDEPLA